MTNLQRGAEDYLTLRRSLGFKLKRPSRFIREFVIWLAEKGESQITTRLALQWATQPQHLQRAEWAARLSAIRGFARYWSSMDGATEVPPTVCCRSGPSAPRRTRIPLLSSNSYCRRQAACQLSSSYSLSRTAACWASW